MIFFYSEYYIIVLALLTLSSINNTLDNCEIFE